MLDKQRIVLVSFADRRYRNAMKRLEGYTEKFPFTERHFCDQTNTFDKKYWSNLKPWLYRRGFGYWKWKADLVKYYLDKLEEGDIVAYSDGGICWNDTPAALRRFDEYLHMLSPERPILTFQEPYVEQEWTKGDLLMVAGVYDNESICTSNQLWGVLSVNEICGVGKTLEGVGCHERSEARTDYRQALLRSQQERI